MKKLNFSKYLGKDLQNHHQFTMVVMLCFSQIHSLSLENVLLTYLYQKWD
jgi:hypothetical protein